MSIPKDAPLSKNSLVKLSDLATEKMSALVDRIPELAFARDLSKENKMRVSALLFIAPATVVAYFCTIARTQTLGQVLLYAPLLFIISLIAASKFPRVVLTAAMVLMTASIFGKLQLFADLIFAFLVFGPALVDKERANFALRACIWSVACIAASMINEPSVSGGLLLGGLAYGLSWHAAPSTGTRSWVDKFGMVLLLIGGIAIFPPFAFCLFSRRVRGFFWGSSSPSQNDFRIEQIKWLQTLAEKNFTGDNLAQLNEMVDLKRGSILYTECFGLTRDHPVQIAPAKGNAPIFPHHIAVAISRDLSAMNDRERECLRISKTLQSVGFLNDWEIAHIDFGLIFGDGKCTRVGITWWLWDEYTNTQKPWENYTTFSGDKAENSEGILKRLVECYGVSVESAVNLVLERYNVYRSQHPDIETVTKIEGRLSGGSRFFSTSDLQKSGFTRFETATSLRLGYLDDSDFPINYDGDGSLFTVAPPGSGKSQCNVIPNLMNYLGPVIVLDVKGECYKNTASWRSAFVGPVHKFAPLDADSAKYNPLDMIRNDEESGWEDLWEDSTALAELLILTESKNDPFWEGRAKKVVTAAIAWARIRPDEKKRNMQTVLNVLAKVDWQEFVFDLMKVLGGKIDAARREGQSLQELTVAAATGSNQLTSILEIARKQLAVWETGKVAKVTKSSSWSPEDLRRKESPTTIYLCIPPSEIETYAPLLRVFVAQHIRALTRELPAKDSPKILFMLDELPRLGHMQPIQEALEIGRQYNIRLWMFCQSLGQMKQAYENADGMIGSCAVRIFMNPSLHDGTAKKLSEDLGTKESVLSGKTEPLIEPQELAGPAFTNYQLIFGPNAKPAKVRKAYAYDDPEIRTKRNAAIAKHEQELLDERTELDELRLH